MELHHRNITSCRCGTRVGMNVFIYILQYDRIGGAFIYTIALQDAANTIFSHIVLAGQVLEHTSRCNLFLQYLFCITEIVLYDVFAPFSVVFFLFCFEFTNINPTLPLPLSSSCFHRRFG